MNLRSGSIVLHSLDCTVERIKLEILLLKTTRAA